MSSFLTLKTRVQTWVIDAPTAVQTEIGGLVNEAMRTLQELRNFKVMEAQADLTTTVATRDLGAVVTDFKEYQKGEKSRPYLVRNDGRTRKIEVAERGDALKVFGLTDVNDVGEPKLLVEDEPTDVLDARQWEVYPFPDAGSDYGDGEYRIKLPYYKFLPVLSADGDTNWFTENAEWYLTFQALSEAFYLDHDEARGALWEQRALVKLQKAVQLDKRRRISHIGSLVPNTGALGLSLRG